MPRCAASGAPCYFEGKTQREIGDIVGVSQMHVSRILQSTLTRLRAVLGEQADA